jgi:Streptococcus thermophilus bacteriophage Gp111 protein
MPTAKLVPNTTDPAAKFARREKLRIVMKQAWSWARHGAAKFGGRPIQYLAQALRIVWAEKKRLAREIAESRARVLAEVAKIREEATAAPSLPLVRYWTPPPGLRSFTRSARRGPLGPVTVRV